MKYSLFIPFSLFFLLASVHADTVYKSKSAAGSGSAYSPHDTEFSFKSSKVKECVLTIGDLPDTKSGVVSVDLVVRFKNGRELSNSTWIPAANIPLKNGLIDQDEEERSEVRYKNKTLTYFTSKEDKGFDDDSVYYYRRQDHGARIEINQNLGFPKRVETWIDDKIDVGMKTLLSAELDATCEF